MYNGWSNYETWLTNVWFDDFTSVFSDLAYDGVFDDLNDDEINEYAADYIKTWVDEHIESQLGNDPNGFIRDMIDSFTREIDYGEIASHYVADIVADVAVRNREKETA